MTEVIPPLTEIQLLLESLCEDRLTSLDASRLEQLVLSSPEARWTYLTYIDLHGTLYWDAAGAGSPEPLSSSELLVDASLVETRRAIVNPVSRRRVSPFVGATAACLLLMIVGVWHVSRPRATQIVVAPQPVRDQSMVSDTLMGRDDTIGTVGSNRVRRSEFRNYGSPVALEGSSVPTVDFQATERSPAPIPSDQMAKHTSPRSSQDVVAGINREIESRWNDLDIQPSERADDAEWMRRASLDLIGRIPTVREADAFLADSHEGKRDELIARLVSDSAFVRNLTTKWTNLLIGRASNPQVDRDAFQKFLRLNFAANRPWNQIVAELISAEGINTENGATNFLIAHLNNDATPATAVVTKLFLGRRVQCNQCHNNPFDESKQVAFWEMNSFFQQTTAISRQRRDPRTGRMAYVCTELVTQDAGGPTYFETQNGLMRVAYPRFNDQPIDPSPDTNRRRELAQLMTYGEQPQLAAAFVNRMWEHFCGSGFTRCVDDMGSHESASHPELLTLLSEQFIQSGYDIQQLVRWICLSAPYQLSSRYSETNHDDDPSMGELPAFSRMYVRPMSPEQTYDSFVTATKAHRVGAVDWIEAEKNRQEWLQQFVVTFQTDENEETTTFEGSIGNALSLMNGPLINKALDVSAGSFLGEVVRQKSSDVDKIRALCVAALSRPPVPTELSSMKKMVRDASTLKSGRANADEAYQDLFWALLNSNEFALVR